MRPTEQPLHARWNAHPAWPCSLFEKGHVIRRRNESAEIGNFTQVWYCKPCLQVAVIPAARLFHSPTLNKAKTIPIATLEHFQQCKQQQSSMFQEKHVHPSSSRVQSEIVLRRHTQHCAQQTTTMHKAPLLCRSCNKKGSRIPCSNVHLSTKKATVGHSTICLTEQFNQCHKTQEVCAVTHAFVQSDTPLQRRPNA